MSLTFILSPFILLAGLFAVYYYGQYVFIKNKKDRVRKSLHGCLDIYMAMAFCSAIAHVGATLDLIYPFLVGVYFYLKFNRIHLKYQKPVFWLFILIWVISLIIVWGAKLYFFGILNVGAGILLAILNYYTIKLNSKN